MPETTRCATFLEPAERERAPLQPDDEKQRARAEPERHDAHAERRNLVERDAHRRPGQAPREAERDQHQLRGRCRRVRVRDWHGTCGMGETAGWPRCFSSARGPLTTRIASCMSAMPTTMLHCGTVRSRALARCRGPPGRRAGRRPMDLDTASGDCRQAGGRQDRRLAFGLSGRVARAERPPRAGSHGLAGARPERRHRQGLSRAAC